MEQGRRIIIGHGNTWHDPAIAVDAGGRLFAEAIERHTGCKRGMESARLWYSWRPLGEFLERSVGLPVRDREVVAVSSWSGNTPSSLLDRPEASPVAALLAGSVRLEPIAHNQMRWLLRGHHPRIFGPPDESQLGVRGAEGVTWNAKGLVHQLAHAANAVYTSPFEECVVMVLDGYGEGSAISFFHFRDDEFELLHQEDPGVSLGLLYAALTQYAGFDPYEGEEWKVMGLAAYGQPREEIVDFFRRRLVVDGLSLQFEAPEGSRVAFDAEAWAELERLTGGFRGPDDPDVMRSADLAAAFQATFADTVVELARGAGRLGLSRNLAFGGGCALNSATNGRLVPETDFERLHVPCAPGDDGNALGAVLYERHCVRGEPRTPEVMTPYLGSEIPEPSVRRALDLGGVPHRRIEDPAALYDEVAGRLADGEIVAWVRGRAEFGPRALGHRSILADPRREEMRDRINGRVKFREPYRPLAPAILDEHGDDYFEDYQSSPYMERTLRFRPEMRERVPAVVHEDGTGRLQSVGRRMSPGLHGLLEAFHRRTEVPVLLNTSFNVMGAPIVHSVQDALAVFFSTDIDLLVLDGVLVEKSR